eukprot:TRINITY_DN7631_c0_g1_i1.p1 TRINITY_DN7631_c0_g1~~TRINITY_DN7631_c0_g1_i1.p1  ORF type:complete len:396 (+),score=58.23 TRINITY_DN7631_c0_g1_i1:89-1276(+)
MEEKKATKVVPREMFNRRVTVLALRIPAQFTTKFLSACKQSSSLLKKQRIKAVVKDSDPNYRRLLLSEKITSSADLPDTLRQLCLSDSVEMVKEEVELTYGNFDANEVLTELLPQEIVVPSSFEIIGHIAHLNLRGNQLPFKHIIGQVIIDKNAKIKTVVNKCQNISTVFRTFQMEVIAGDDNLNAILSESNCKFKLNYGEVYWNSRLQTEHMRLISRFGAGEVVCDMFAGIGPFAVPAAKNNACLVYANDLNPRSYYYLCQNIALNKLSTEIEAFNLDGRVFVQALIADARVGRRKMFDHVVMNLPASAETFLDVFQDFPSDLKPPLIHCYMFSDAKDLHQDCIDRIEVILKRKIGNPLIHDVRDVSPHKKMFCVTFRLPILTSEVSLKRKRES